MPTPRGNLLKRKLRILFERRDKLFGTLGPLGINRIESFEHLRTESALDLSETEVVRPQTLNVEIHIAHGRLPIAQPIAWVSTHSIVSQTRYESSVRLRCDRQHAALAKSRDVLVRVKTE